MVTVIDMTSGELIYRSSPAQQREAAAETQGPAFSLPALALQEITLERQPIEMPPELAQISIGKFLTKFN
jgi:hypothetical protein